ncbi:MAG: flagellar protein [Lachnospiraceae bacterium]
MNVRNCRKCGKIFNYVSGPTICPKCKEKTEEKFQEVKKFVQDNRGAGIPQISDECDVEISQIQAWIREERLFFDSDSPIGIECEGCGTMIKTGRFCDKCKNDMAKGFTPDAPKKEPVKKKADTATNPKMRFL